MSQEYWKNLASVKREAPVSKQLDYSELGRLLYSWLGTKIFSLLDSRVIVIKDNEDNEDNKENNVNDGSFNLEVLRIEQ